MFAAKPIEKCWDDAVCTAAMRISGKPCPNRCVYRWEEWYGTTGVSYTYSCASHYKPIDEGREAPGFTYRKDDEAKESYCTIL
jgi:hypothetical protein